MDDQKSTLIIENAYCCGHGDIIHRLENYCIAQKIDYIKQDAKSRSIATLGDKQVELKPTLTLSQALRALGLQSAQSSQHKTEECS